MTPSRSKQAALLAAVLPSPTKGTDAGSYPNFDMSGGDVRDFPIALVYSDYAKRLRCFQFIDFEFSNGF